MTTEQISQLPLARLRESPLNYRKTFRGITELAANIKAEGRVHSPLLVRPIVDQEGGTATHEIVFGHRRFRAASEAGLESVPCMVRAMADDEVRRAQVAENLAREDVHPIEEAEGFQAMRDLDGITADQLAANLGQSRSYVYGRLKLPQACPKVREACLAGAIGSEVALLLARLRTDKLQEKALARISAKNWKLEDGGAMSFRSIRYLLNDEFTLQLKEAIFPREDAELVPAAGACSGCPKRSGNAPEFEDVTQEPRSGAGRWAYGVLTNAGADVCTDPDCWAAKKKAYLQREAEALVAAGKVVVSGNKAKAALSADGKVRGAYVAAADVGKVVKAVKGAAPVVQLLQDQRTGKVVKAYARADLVAAGVKGMKEPAKKAAGSYEARQAELRAESERKREKARQDTARNRALLACVREEAARRERSEHELRLVAAAMVARLDFQDLGLALELYEAKTQDQLQKKLLTMDAAQLALVMLDCMLVPGIERHWPGDKPSPLLNLASHYGIDPKAVAAEATGAAKDQRTGELLQDGQDVDGNPVEGEE